MFTILVCYVSMLLISTKYRVQLRLMLLSRVLQVIHDELTYLTKCNVDVMIRQMKGQKINYSSIITVYPRIIKIFSKFHGISSNSCQFHPDPQTHTVALAGKNQDHQR